MDFWVVVGLEVGRGNESEKRLESGRYGSYRVILLRRLIIGRRVFVGCGLILDTFLRRMKRTRDLGNRSLFCGEEGREGQRGLGSWRLSHGRRLEWKRLHRYVTFDAGGVCTRW